MDEYYIWKVERVSDEFYWDNYVMGIFYEKELAEEFATLMRNKGYFVMLTRSLELCEVVPKTINFEELC